MPAVIKVFRPAFIFGKAQAAPLTSVRTALA